MKKILSLSLALLSMNVFYAMDKSLEMDSPLIKLNLTDATLAVLKEKNFLCYAEAENVFLSLDSFSPDIKAFVDSIEQLKEKRFTEANSDKARIKNDIAVHKAILLEHLKKESVLRVTNMPDIVKTLQNNKLAIVFTTHSMPRSLVSALLKANNINLAPSIIQIPKSFIRETSTSVATSITSHEHDDQQGFVRMQNYPKTIFARTLCKKGILSIHGELIMDIPASMEDFCEHCNNRKACYPFPISRAAYTTSFDIMTDVSNSEDNA